MAKKEQLDHIQYLTEAPFTMRKYSALVTLMGNYGARKRYSKMAILVSGILSTYPTGSPYQNGYIFARNINMGRWHPTTGINPLNATGEGDE